MDPIADFLTTIRNGYLAKKETVTVSKSKMRSALAEILVKQGFLLAAEYLDHEINLPLHYLPEHCVLPIQVRLRRIRDEKLAPVRVRPCVGHRDHSRFMG